MTEFLYSYILDPYIPLRKSQDGDISSSDILDLVLEKSYPHLIEGKENIIQTIGKDSTVWGVQKGITDKALSVEYYFYTQNEDHRLLWSRLQRCLGNALSPHLQNSSEIPVDFPVGMFSLDMPSNEKGKIKDVDVYMIEPGKGFCTHWDDDGMFMKNKYWFSHDYDSARQMLNSNGIHSACCMFGNKGKWDKSICLSRKRDRWWGIYYSGVNVDCMGYFLDKFGYPGYLRELFELNSSRMDHMTYDFGYDFLLLPGGMIKCLKSGFYGYF